MTGEDLRHWVRLPLGTDDDALRQARRFVRLQAEQCGLDEDRGDAVAQVTAELLHAGGEAMPAAVEVAEVADGMLVAVVLPGGDAIPLGEPTTALLDALASEWGRERSDGGARLWCHVPRDAGGDVHVDGAARGG